MIIILITTKINKIEYLIFYLVMFYKILKKNEAFKQKYQDVIFSVIISRSNVRTFSNLNLFFMKNNYLYYFIYFIIILILKDFKNSFK